MLAPDVLHQSIFVILMLRVVVSNEIKIRNFTTIQVEEARSMSAATLNGFFFGSRDDV